MTQDNSMVIANLGLASDHLRAALAGRQCDHRVERGYQPEVVVIHIVISINREQ
jgi:hypothetical protein